LEVGEGEILKRKTLRSPSTIVFSIPAATDSRTVAPPGKIFCPGTFSNFIPHRNSAGIGERTATTTKKDITCITH
jgi:hypothetical protein